MADEDVEWEFLEGSQVNLANFMRRLLVHRFESSIFAFQISLRNLIDNSLNILQWIDVLKEIPVYKKGMLPDVKGILESGDDDDLFGGVDRVEAEVSKLKSKGLFELDMDYIKPEFVDDVRNDITILQGIYDDWFDETGKITKDPKFDSFVALVKQMLKDDPKRKIVLFSGFADTIEYLGQRLKDEKLPVFAYSSRIASDANKKTIIENFDAGLPNGRQRDDYKILVATDAISEGYNLHRAGTIFNYDIPYNPTRVIQRIGRINRVNKKVFDELYIYNYFPSVIGEQNVSIERISTIKMRMIHAIMGGDTKILDKDEELTFSNFNKQFREAQDETEQESWETKFRNDWESAKASAELAQALEIFPRTKIKRTVKKDKSGVLVFGKRGTDSVFRYAPNTESETEPLFPEDALPIFQAAKDEEAVKVSDAFDAIYQKIKADLFKSPQFAISAPRGKAMNKVRAFMAEEANKPYSDYLENLLRVLEMDGLNDLSPINKAKTCEELHRKVSPNRIEKILHQADLIDHEPESVILAEELI
jgi:hypothetical protein